MSIWNRMHRRGFLQRLSGLGLLGMAGGTSAAEPSPFRPQRDGRSIIVDVHTHTPTHEHTVPPSEVEVVTLNRPDKPVTRTYTWQQYLDAMAPIRKACVFGVKRVAAHIPRVRGAKLLRERSPLG